MFDRWRYILPMLPLRVSEKEKLGKPKEEMGNLKMDLNTCILMISKYNICKLNICILVILRYNISNLNILRIHIRYFRGHNRTRFWHVRRRSYNEIFVFASCFSGSHFFASWESSEKIPLEWLFLRKMVVLQETYLALGRWLACCFCFINAS
jgi:hypothetical protein